MNFNINIEKLPEQKLSFNQWKTLLKVSKNDIALSALAKWLGVTVPLVTQTKVILKKMGLVETVFKNGNRRKAYMKITDYGLEYINCCRAEFDELHFSLVCYEMINSDSVQARIASNEFSVDEFRKTFYSGINAALGTNIEYKPLEQLELENES